ncbi:MAG: hypothetical protein ABSG23_05800 [Terriglobales bacterium]
MNYVTILLKITLGTLSSGLRDTVLLRVRVLGEGKVCHTGTRSCFTQELPLGTALDGQKRAAR